MRIRLLISTIFLLSGAVLSVPTGAMGQAFLYAQECVENVENATVHVPADAAPSLPSGTPVEPGDTIAVYTTEGTCAGYGAWTEGEGAVLAAAGADSLSTLDDGYTAGDSLKFEVFDVSEGQAIDVGKGATFAPCGDVEVPVCGEGAYEDGSYHQVVGFGAVASVTRTLAITEGQNLVSIPVETDLPFKELLPMCSSGYFYSPGDGYTPIDSDETIPFGVGAVVRCSAGTTTVTGHVAPPTIEVDAGWNLIGAPEDTVDVDAITTSPSGILDSDFLTRGPEGQLQSVTELRPGTGYWIDIAEAGTLDVSGTSSAPLAGTSSSSPVRTAPPTSAPVTTSTDPELEDASRLLFVDARGRKTTLWLKEGLTQKQRARFALPPAPPGTMLDVRFASGHAAAALSSDEEPGPPAQTRQVQLQGAAYPIEVRLEPDEEDRRLHLSGGENEFTLSKKQSSVEIQQSTDRLAVAAAPRPEAFRLGKARPHPVRTRATLEYALPEQAEVSIVVYDVLGRQVARLVDGTRPTGFHQAQVDASRLPSGKYFVRMKAESFRKTRPLTVVR